jgi:hypothetical protein
MAWWGWVTIVAILLGVPWIAFFLEKFRHRG